MDSNQLRALYLDYFAAHGHTVVPSSSLVPAGDATLLFTNAGMVQFKDVFTGAEKRAYTRATSAQKCVRAGGKHNDLENVGYTARHHTFFEMLGNFSFGDYFKREAIHFAWEFVTGEKWLGISPSRLMVTVYHDDDEAWHIWHDEMGVPAERIVRIGDNKGAKYASDNFWTMGDTGPCGPCSEIFYDHDPDGSRGIAGGPPGSPDEDGDRWIEIWNLVFTQFDRHADGTLTPLPKPNVDTGMGLERITALMQGTNDNYRIDIFQRLIGEIAALAGQKPYANASQKVIADHIRSTCFLIADGVLPSNEGRGYVLRRIMRRAIRHGYKIGLDQPFFYKLVAPLAEVMGAAYPELVEKRTQIEAQVRNEEESFAQTLEKGMKLLDDALASTHGKTLPGDIIFKLYDTYGFPVDLTADVARERGLTLDLEGYEREMNAQRERARAASTFKTGETLPYDGADTHFTGYETLQGDATVLALYRDGAPVEKLAAGEAGIIVLDTTPFYAESGGQVGDRGTLTAAGMEFAVADTRKLRTGVFAHHGTQRAGTLERGTKIHASVADSLRRATMRNHSATHLMHRALREVLGTHVEQKGSLVDEHRTRFDFSQPQPMTAQQVAEVEDCVNRAILANVAVATDVMAFDDAVKTGAMALFGEKYGETVRVLTMGPKGADYSVELCGGTHVARTGDIGLFKIISESGVAAGVRRVEAVTGENALAYLRETEQRVHDAAALLRANPEELTARIQQLLDLQHKQDKEIAALKSQRAAEAGGELASQARSIKGVKVLSARVDGVEGGALRGLVDELKQKLGSGVILLATCNGGKVALIAGVTKDLTAKLKAGELVNRAAACVGGKGGGRPDMAQAGGTQEQGVPAALETAYAYVEQQG
ncbi:MAG: alanine--tRNA ligase [Nevskiaceae bacterium]|nr:MAG: alanine--tRNA ligase [Nevskiaceae bacterium]TBR71573.1 MAG: alanine--tRNA ligase [Nevskiaceae bacterium]